jgi:uncharacterized protein YlxP (DUF503 family)
MNILKTKFKDLLIFKSENYKEKRGLLRELVIEKHLKKE